MEPHTHSYQVNDPEHNVRFIVLAYRQLDEREALKAVATFLSTQKRRPKNKTFRILTTLGAHPGR
jgi:hypothetical protein